MKRDPTPGPVGREGGARLISEGEPASAIVAQTLPVAHAVTVKSSLGNVELRPGAIWDGRMMLVSASPMNVFYTVGDSLYESSADGFVNECWPNVLRSAASRDMPAAYLAEAEAAFLRDFFVPWRSILGMDAARVGLFYCSSRGLMYTAMRYCPLVLYLLIVCRRRYSKLFTHLPASCAAGEIMATVPFTASGRNAAAFIARALKGGRPGASLGALLTLVVAIADIVDKLADVLRGLFIFCIVWFVVRMFIIALFPPAAAVLPTFKYEDLRAKALEAFADFLIKRLAEQGDTRVSQSEAVDMLEQLIDDPSAVSKMQELEAALSRLVPVMVQMREGLKD